MSTLSLAVEVNDKRPADFNFTYCTSKLDSTETSLFQCVGLAYRKFDVITHRMQENPYAAKSTFVSDLINLGFKLYQAEQLLSANKWPHRMGLAWDLIQLKDRSDAEDLDYDQYENYWPNLKFLELSDTGVDENYC